MLVRNLYDEDEGVTLVEYALLLALIAVVAIVAVTVLGAHASTLLSTAANKL
jgi:pilus assembly protein Flp/PilA